MSFKPDDLRQLLSCVSQTANTPDYAPLMQKLADLPNPELMKRLINILSKELRPVVQGTEKIEFHQFLDTFALTVTMMCVIVHNELAASVFHNAAEELVG